MSLEIMYQKNATQNLARKTQRNKNRCRKKKDVWIHT